MTLGLDSSTFELVHQVGPWQRSALCAIGISVADAGLAPDEETAHDLVWEALNVLGEPHCPARDALSAAGFDVDLIRPALSGVLERWRRERDRRELEIFDGPAVALW